MRTPRRDLNNLLEAVLKEYHSGTSTSTCIPAFHLSTISGSYWSATSKMTKHDGAIFSFKLEGNNQNIQESITMNQESYNIN